MSNKNGFVEELQARLPGLNGEQAMGWAAAVVKHLAQALDDPEREELERYLPPNLTPVVEQGTKVAELFGKENPGDFFVMATLDAGAPPSEKGARETLANVLAAIRKRIPQQPAEEIAKKLPEDIAELWVEAEAA